MIIFYTTYLSIVFGMRKVIKPQLPPHAVAMAFRIHDLFGCIANLVLVMLLVMEVWSIWNRLGAYATICSEEALTPVSVQQRLPSRISSPLF